ncbi:MAG: discoidin domain-containing protein, partial [Pedobacter sp.]|nr:discoidin domain-containing protein [Chitinophagaceae bacterium]
FAIKLTAITNPKGLVANGQDLALVEFEVVDSKGNRCPTALNTINFNITGNGIWRGGMAQGPDNYILSTKIPVECGVNRAFIRTTTVAGNITIKASSQGLKDGNLLLVTLPFKTENGLSKTMPNEGLVSNLEKGATPAIPSFIVSRKALVISKVKAGANSDSAYKSYDDNESTDWVNDGNAATAWIEYELENPSTISEIVLKLNNFRTRAYPLKISVDGHVVFNQTTTPNLGYFTAVFKPTKGSKVKIELAGNSNDKQDNNVEVNGKKLDDGVARNDASAKGRLSIIEVEIYEKL